MSFLRTNTFILMLLASGFLISRAAHAETYHTCAGFITSIPTVITTQGTWCLKQDLTTAITTGDAITIATNNVTLDCNDFKLGGLAGGNTTQANGIFAGNRQNAVVRHCNVRGFYRGVYLSGSTTGGHVIEDNRFNDNTYVGIVVEGEGSVIRRNQVFDTGGSLVTPGDYGIYATYSIDIIDNTVFGVLATAGGNGDAIGILTFDNFGGSINGNRIRGLVKNGTGTTFGIVNTLSDHVVMRDNDLTGDATVGSTAMSCGDANSSARGNTINRFALASSTCNDDGGNVFRP